MKIAIASDHKGFKLKGELIKDLENNHEVFDVGTYSEESCDYPDFAFKLGELVTSKEVDFGVAICGSGIGISIACNKVKGIRCAKVNNVDEAKITRIDNNANVIAFSAQNSEEEALNMINNFVNTEFPEEERHLRRINKIKIYEARHYNDR